MFALLLDSILSLAYRLKVFGNMELRKIFERDTEEEEEEEEEKDGENDVTNMFII
jgi:hypothetical protein